MNEQTPFHPFNPNPSPPIAPEQPAAPKAKGRPRKIVETAEQAPAEPRQRRKKADGDKPALKFGLQTILHASAGLNEDDLASFEKIVSLLSETGKPARERLLEALGKIFE